MKTILIILFLIPLLAFGQLKMNSYNQMLEKTKNPERVLTSAPIGFEIVENTVFVFHTISQKKDFEYTIVFFGKSYSQETKLKFPKGKRLMQIPIPSWATSLTVNYSIIKL